MELSFIAAALRRRAWLLPLGLLLGLVVGTRIGGSTSSWYEARAVLIIQPPQNPLGGNTFVNDPDRYVIGQLSVLQSSELAARLASSFPGETTSSIRGAVTVTQQPRTDLVTVTARSGDPARAEQLANAWAELYISDLRERASVSQGPALETVRRQIDDLNGRLAGLQQTISDNQKVIADQSTLVTALSAGGTNPAADPRILAVREAVTAATAKVTEAQAQQQLLLQQYNEFLQNRSQLELAANLRVASEIVQPALTPTLPTSDADNRSLLLGGTAGILAGLFAAVAWARLSMRLIDEDQAEAVLGQPVIGRLTRNRAFTGPLADQLVRPLPDRARAAVHQVCVRAESLGPQGRPLRVAVIGTTHRSGCTTVATALATQFAATGARVVLVDADQHDPEITGALADPDRSGIVGVLAGSTGGRRDPGPLSETGRPEIRALGFSTGGATVLRREDISRLLDGAHAAAPDAQVIVVDGGALPAAASTLQLAHLADAVVLAVPFRRQRADELADLAGQLHGLAVLPVLTHPSRRARRLPVVTPTAEDRAEAVETDAVPEPVG